METAGTEITYRCKDCRDCPECKKSDRFESISIQEEIEQTVIERSVNVDISIGRTIAKLPFLSNPVYKLRPNTGMAFKVYQSQVRKLGKSPEEMDQVTTFWVCFINLCSHVRYVKFNTDVNLLYSVKMNSVPSERVCVYISFIMLGLLLSECDYDQIILFITHSNPTFASVFKLVIIVKLYQGFSFISFRFTYFILQSHQLPAFYVFLCFKSGVSRS